MNFQAFKRLSISDDEGTGGLIIKGSITYHLPGRFIIIYPK